MFGLTSPVGSVHPAAIAGMGMRNLGTEPGSRDIGDETWTPIIDGKRNTP